jgi:hypothetical protein
MSGVRRPGGEAIVAQRRQCKACMVKAKLPEPQSARLTVELRRRIAETSYREECGPCPSGRTIWRLIEKTGRHPAYPASLSMRQGNRTNREPNHAASLLHRQRGIAYTGDRYTAPAWRRSPHSTQGWPVTGSAGGQEVRPHGQGYKRWVTARESPAAWGKGDSLHGSPTTQKTRVC